MNNPPTIYDIDHAREWLAWKCQSYSKHELQVVINMLAAVLSNLQIYRMFQVSIDSDRKKNLPNG